MQMSNERLKDVLAKVLDSDKDNLILDRAARETLREFIVALTAQNAELALRVQELSEGKSIRPKIQTEWSPFL